MLGWQETTLHGLALDLGVVGVDDGAGVVAIVWAF
jgi:hypothetical protein